MTIALTASEFLERLQVGMLPTEQYSVTGDVFFGDATFNGDVFFRSATFNGDVIFGGATFAWDVIFENATFNGDVIFGGATFAWDVIFENATFNGDAFFRSAAFEGEGVHVGSNPAIGWLLERWQADIIYTTADARHMCGHPHPMHGWKCVLGEWVLNDKIVTTS